MIPLLTSEIPDPTGWLVSIKMDGIRALWTGTALLTRHGRRLDPPKWFIQGLPARRLDGELWMGNQTFPCLLSAIQTHSASWAGIEFHVFDLAEVGTIEERIARLATIPLPTHVHRVEHRICSGMADLDRNERKVVNAGGEGVVIRRPGSPYRPGRMGDVIKVKRLVADVDRPI
jgi:DNA ligase-1